MNADYPLITIGKFPSKFFFFFFKKGLVYKCVTDIANRNANYCAKFASGDTIFFILTLVNTLYVNASNVAKTLFVEKKDFNTQINVVSHDRIRHAFTSIC